LISNIRNGEKIEPSDKENLKWFCSSCARSARLLDFSSASLFLLILFVLQSSSAVMKCVTLDVCRKLLQAKEMDEGGGFLARKPPPTRSTEMGGGGIQK
jgi:hypothetical protein